MCCGNLVKLFIVPLIVSGCSGNKKEVAPVDNRPNVILIMTDDQGYGDLGCHGSPYVKTPAIDSLYNESVRFPDFHVDPSCSPTRSALLTGNYSARAGVWHTIGGRSLLKEGMTTMPEVFEENGYETAIFGKWHLGGNYPFRPQNRGFKETLVHGGGGIGQNSDYWGNDYLDDTYRHNGKLEKYKRYSNNVWFSEAIKYIKKNKDKPFFCYLSTNVPHAPLHVNEKYSEPYKKEVSDRLAKYYGMVSKIDEDMGTLLGEIKNMGLDKNTIVIFMTDNGPCPWFGGIVIDFKTGFVKEGYSAGMRGGKIWGYENAHRVPFFIRWPKGNIGGGKDINALAAHIDIMPTLIDLCGLKVVGTLNMDGRSLAPLLQGKIKEWSDDRSIIVQNQRIEYPVKDKEYQVLTKKWRLVRREKDELYDIQKDPGEHEDLAALHPEVVKELYGKYNDWWDDVSTNFDKYAQIQIGTSQENPVMLSTQDAHSRNGKKIWVVNVAKSGKYEVALNRWPQESGKKMSENLNGDREIAVKNAWLKIGNIERTKQVDKKITTVKFTIDLKAGTTCFQTAINLLEKGKTLSTQCVYVTYLGEGNTNNLKKYVASVPDKILKEGYAQKVIPYD